MRSNSSSGSSQSSVSSQKNATTTTRSTGSTSGSSHRGTSYSQGSGSSSGSGANHRGNGTGGSNSGNKGSGTSGSSGSSSGSSFGNPNRGGAEITTNNNKSNDANHRVNTSGNRFDGHFDQGNNNKDDNNNGSNHRPGGGNGSVKPDGNRPGGNDNRPGGNDNRPGGGSGSVKPDGNRPGGNSAPPPGGYRPGGVPGSHHSSAPPPGTGSRPHPRPTHFSPPPTPYLWNRPVPPPPPRPRIFTPRPGVPVINAVLGLTFGSAYSYGLDLLWNSYYDIVGTLDNIICIANVMEFGLLWPEVSVFYNNGLMYGTRFQYASDYYNDYRYQTVYRQLCNTFGTPISTTYEYGLPVTTWWGGSANGYVTLSISQGYNSYNRPIYYTNVYYGHI